MECGSIKKSELKGKIVEMRSKRNDSDEVNKKVAEKLMKWYFGIAGATFAAVVGFGAWTVVSYTSLNREVGEVNTKVDDLSGRVDDLSGRVDDLGERVDDLSGRVNGVHTDVAVMKEKIAKLESYHNTAIDATDTVLNQVQASVEYNGKELHTTALESTDVIGTDSNGNACLAGDWVNKTVLLTYTEGTQEVYFYGQFNENYHWNDNCLINVYNQDNTLSVITDATYDDGELIEYKQILNTSKGDEWVYSEREPGEDNTSGKSFVYVWSGDAPKSFTRANANGNDIYSAEEYRAKIDDQLIAFYEGDTSNGEYNDSTGNAYAVKFAEDGTVKVLYTGGFKDGLYDDSTGNAWEIVFDSSNDINKYFYYKGRFSDGTRVTDEGIEYVTREQIEKIILDGEFNCDLKWYGEE